MPSESEPDPASFSSEGPLSSYEGDDRLRLVEDKMAVERASWEVERQSWDRERRAWDRERDLLCELVSSGEKKRSQHAREVERVVGLFWPLDEGQAGTENGMLACLDAVDVVSQVREIAQEHGESRLLKGYSSGPGSCRTLLESLGVEVRSCSSGNESSRVMAHVWLDAMQFALSTAPSPSQATVIIVTDNLAYLPLVVQLRLNGCETVLVTGHCPDEQSRRLRAVASEVYELELPATGPSTADGESSTVSTVQTESAEESSAATPEASIVGLHSTCPASHGRIGDPVDNPDPSEDPLAETSLRGSDPVDVALPAPTRSESGTWSGSSSFASASEGRSDRSDLDDASEIDGVAPSDGSARVGGLEFGDDDDKSEDEHVSTGERYRPRPADAVPSARLPSSATPNPTASSVLAQAQEERSGDPIVAAFLPLLRFLASLPNKKPVRSLCTDALTRTDKQKGDFYRARGFESWKTYSQAAQKLGLVEMGLDSLGHEWIALTWAGSWAIDGRPNPSATSPTESTKPSDLSAFDPLLRAIAAFLPARPRPLRSDCACALSKDDQKRGDCYRALGFPGWREYAAAAKARGLVVLGDGKEFGPSGYEWIALSGKGRQQLLTGAGSSAPATHQSAGPSQTKKAPPTQPKLLVFTPLLERLALHHPKGARPLRSQIGEELVKRHGPKFYKDRGFEGWRAFAEKAEREGWIKLGAGKTLGQDWVSLTDEGRAEVARR